MEVSSGIGQEVDVRKDGKEVQLGLQGHLEVRNGLAVLVMVDHEMLVAEVH